MTKLHCIVTGRWKENCYVVSEGDDAVIVDPGGEVERILEHVATEGLRVHAVINTHAHYDHLGAVVPAIRAYDVPFHLHPADRDLLRRANFYRTLFLGEEQIEIPEVDVELVDGEELEFGALRIDVLHTPGHTPGSVSFATADRLLTGDTIMAEHVGRTDLPGGDRQALLASIELLEARYPSTTPIHPGHGRAAELGGVVSRVLALPELR